MAMSMHARRQLAGELRRIRLGGTDHSLESVATALGWNKAKVSRIETARVGITRHDLQRVCSLYGLSEDALSRLEAMLEDNDAEWWQAYSDAITATLAEYISLEVQAASITIASSSVVPGLLQTSGYMRAVTGGSPFVTDTETAQTIVDVRTRRQRVLMGPTAPEFTAVLSPAILYLQPGGPAVHREQLQRLLEVGELPNVQVRMLPLDSPAVSFMGTVTLFEFAETLDAGVVAVEHQGGMAFKDSSRDVRRFRRTVRYLRDQALTQEATDTLVRTRLKEL
ncbi:helix-turn-helix domain-containing protein [Streptomycetaceae bacterium NBC_01309]